MLPYLTVNLNSISYFIPNSRKHTPSRDTATHSASKEISHHYNTQKLITMLT